MTGYVRQMDLNTRECRVRAEPSRDGRLVFEGRYHKKVLEVLREAFREEACLHIEVVGNVLMGASIQR